MTTETEAALIIQVPRDGAVDRNWREDEPPSIASGQVIAGHGRRLSGTAVAPVSWHRAR